jgi:hypothetical protein
MVARAEERETRRAYLQLPIHMSDEAAMARFCRENMEFMQAELELYGARDTTKKQVATSRREIGPLHRQRLVAQ